jgi:hypothetical protein
MKKRYKESEVPALVASLTERFETACSTYRLALSTRDSNRSKKELTRGNSRGTNIHKFQCNFAWIIHDIQKGPRCQIDDRVDDAEDLISHINKISVK